MRSEYLDRREMQHVLAALTPPNRLACEIALSTGLRIGDVLRLKTEQVMKGPRFTVQEEKTGKTRRVYLPVDLLRRAQRQSGKLWVFPGRLDGRQHRTRQAVYKDLRRAAAAFRVTEHITPHSLRKVYAVDEYRRTGSLDEVQRRLNHDNVLVTMLYAMSDELTRRKHRAHRKSECKN